MNTKLTRWDQLLLEGLLLIVVLGAGLTGVLGTLDAMTADTVTAAVKVDDDRRQVIGVAPGQRLEVNTAELAVGDPSFGERLLAALPPALGALVAGVVATILLEVVRSVRAGDPFHRRNARRLTAAAVVAVAGGMVASLAAVLASMQFADSAEPDLGVTAAGSFSLFPLGVGLVLAAVAGVFRRGATLRDEVEGLV